MSNPTEHPTRFNKFELQSPLYEKYYKLQGIVPENEFDEFLKCIRTPLSTSFRLTKSSSTYPAVKSKFDHIISNIPTDFKPQTFEWCPDTYQLNVERKQVRKCKEYEFLHKFMVLMNEAGEICRQEIVSMIPALLLGVEVGNSVLDVCAAPGSKTSQLVEMTGPTGCVVANDADKQRSYLLTHQTKRLSAPHLTISNYRAQDLNFNGLQFDRMLCDVPCTGDGTVRKNVDARTKWTVCNAYTLHKEQLSIMRHCLQHVKVGGQFVYSTCSLNPIENEAVVASLLREFGSSIELVDARPMLKGLKYMEGLKQWTVFDKQMNVVTQKTDNIPQTAFPPSTDEVDKYHLEYTLRILPHHQNTGGFYSAVFIKKAETAKVEDPIKNKGKQEEGHDNSKKTTKRKRGQAPIDEQIMQSLLQTSGGKETFDKLKTFYHLSDSFPSEQLYVMGDDCNIIHFLSKKAVNVASVIKVISGGVRMFRKHKSALSDTQRIVSEGCAAVGPYVGDNRRVVVSEAMFKKLLNGLVTVVDVINESKQYTNNATNNTDDIGNACFIMKIADGILKDNLYCAWLGKTYVSLLINKQDLHAFRFLFDIVVVETTRTLDNDPNQQEGLNDAPEKKLKDNNN